MLRADYFCTFIIHEHQDMADERMKKIRTKINKTRRRSRNAVLTNPVTQAGHPEGTEPKIGEVQGRQKFSEGIVICLLAYRPVHIVTTERTNSETSY
jgi:hypothetical protein